MLNHAAKLYNITPKPNSKHQQLLRNGRKPERVVCAECGEGHTTLYKIGEQRYCELHRNRAVE